MNAIKRNYRFMQWLSQTYRACITISSLHSKNVGAILIFLYVLSNVCNYQ